MGLPRKGGGWAARTTDRARIKRRLHLKGRNGCGGAATKERLARAGGGPRRLSSPHPDLLGRGSQMMPRAGAACSRQHRGGARPADDKFRLFAPAIETDRPRPTRGSVPARGHQSDQPARARHRARSCRRLEAPLLLHCLKCSGMNYTGKMEDSWADPRSAIASTGFVLTDCLSRGFLTAAISFRALGAEQEIRFKVASGWSSGPSVPGD